jgi:hypothetical protein
MCNGAIVARCDAEEVAMANDAAVLQKEEARSAPAMKVAVTSAKAPDYVEGRRDFFKYRDLGVTKASEGWMRAQVMKAITGMTQPTGWHYHVCEGQFVYALKGWVELEFEDGTHCRLETGDSCFIRRHEAQRAAHLRRCRDSGGVPAGEYGDRALRAAEPRLNECRSAAVQGA